jgi:hypothetical protein
MLRALRLMLAGIVALAAVPAVSADYRLLRINGFHLKWGTAAYGARADISYGFAGKEHFFPDAINCRKLAPAEALTGGSGSDRGRLEGALAAAFAMWSEAAGVAFRPAHGDEPPHILIGAQREPQGIAYANVWHDEAAASGGIAPLTRATICLNPDLSWFSASASPGAEVFDLRTVLAHEIGHAIGLDHPGATGALMAYRNQGVLDALRPGDIAGALALYGPPQAGPALTSPRRVAQEQPAGTDAPTRLQ